MIPAGDIGGTNTRLALVEVEAGELKIAAEETFPSRERTSLEAAIGDFLAIHSCPVIIAASIGIAGPVRDGRCEATNLPWLGDSRNVAKRLQLKRIGLINDLEASAYGSIGSRHLDLKDVHFLWGMDLLNPSLSDLR